MGRKSVRDILFKLVFENLFVESSDSVTYEEFLKGESMDFEGEVCNIENIDKENLEYLKTNYVSILKNKTEI